jgi:uncharacterized protein YsxB (DUF464 family)
VIAVRVVVDGEGCLSSLSMTGHASLEHGSSGENVVCAAVSGIVRACAQAIAARSTVVATGSATGPGDLHVTVDQRARDDREWMKGVTDVMLGGIGRIATDSPEDVALTIDRVGEVHGA